jgi:hypothetical protein
MFLWHGAALGLGDLAGSRLVFSSTLYFSFPRARTIRLTRFNRGLAYSSCLVNVAFVYDENVGRLFNLEEK